MFAFPLRKLVGTRRALFDARTLFAPAWPGQSGAIHPCGYLCGQRGDAGERPVEQRWTIDAPSVHNLDTLRDMSGLTSLFLVHDLWTKESCPLPRRVNPE